MAHQKDNELKLPPMLLLPRLPRVTPSREPVTVATTQIEMVAKEVEEILHQLKDTQILKDPESYAALLSQLKRDFPMSTVPPTTRSYTSLQFL